MNEGWLLTYHGYDPSQEGLREALCALGNGYFVTRGAAAEVKADDIHYPGTYLAGGYNRLTTTIADRDIENEDLVNLPNWLPLSLRIDEGPWFHIDQVELLDYVQELDVRRGLLTRTLRFRDDQGRTTRWLERRLVSMAHPHLAGLAITVLAEDWSGRVSVRSALDGGVSNNGVARYRELNGQHLETLALKQVAPDTLEILSRTSQSRLELALAARTQIYGGQQEESHSSQSECSQDGISQTFVVALAQQQSLTIEKIVALYSSQDYAISEPALAARQAVIRADRFDGLVEQHTLAWQHLWEQCDIGVEADGSSAINLKLRVHIFHLLQTVSSHSIGRDAGVPARGWHGEAYRGHIFWDELFIFPYLSLRLPALTRALLHYRYRRLPEARWAAQQAGYRGAMYPWQSGSDGREESQQLHLNPESGRWLPDNTHRQRHINIAIACNIWRYFEVTEDYAFLYDYGAEMLLEIARFWGSIAQYNATLDRYEIRGVMGPDEYHTAYPDADPRQAGGLNNNAYTNIMAAWVLNRALDVIALLPDEHRQRVLERIGLSDSEIENWGEISCKLRVVFHGDGIISQFEGYEELPEFDWQDYREKYGEIQRLDRLLEAEDDSPNRYKASKQADVLMLFYLLSGDELGLIFERLGYSFSNAMIPRNIDYYLTRTSHGSTLSWVVHCWVLARAHRPEAWGLFCQAVDSDIADIQGGTTPEGIHLGAMAGTVDLVQRCFTGIETRAGILHFNPSLPSELHSLVTPIYYRGHRLKVAITHDELRVSSQPVTAEPITIAYRGHFRKIAPGQGYVFPLLKPEQRDRDENQQISDIDSRSSTPLTRNA